MRGASTIAFISPQKPNPAILLTVVLPTYNERPNVRLVVNSLSTVLCGLPYELIFVDDDSPDGTAEEVRQLAECDPSIRVIQRIGRRGLASACLEGMLASSAPYIAVMDADLQHDESILPGMLHCIQDQELDLVVGSRLAAGGSMGQFSRSRVLLSRLGRRLSRFITPCELSDPMSGYFVVNRKFLEEVVHSVSAVGFKILVDMIASSPRPVHLVEVPYVFRERQQQTSKMTIRAGIEFLYLVAEKRCAKLLRVTTSEKQPHRVAWTFAVIAWIGVIFFSSSSAALHYCETAYRAVATFLFGPNRHTPPFGLLHLLADKGLHVTLFFVLALLLWQAIPPSGRKWLFILLSGLCVGSASEYLQSFFPDRDPAIRDVLINLGGTALGLGARLLIPRRTVRAPTATNLKSA